MHAFKALELYTRLTARLWLLALRGLNINSQTSNDEYERQRRKHPGTDRRFAASVKALCAQSGAQPARCRRCRTDCGGAGTAAIGSVAQRCPIGRLVIQDTAQRLDR